MENENVWVKPNDDVIKHFEYVFNGVKMIPSYIIWTEELHPTLIKKN